jgi:uncharacterized protein (TIGR02284 family)
MSDEATTVKELIKTLEDGRDGFAKAAERLEKNSAVDVGRRFREFSAQRGAMADELRRCARLEGHTVPAVPEGGTVAGALHRGWIAVKDVLTGDDPSAVISAAEQGEDHAKSKFRDALAEQTLTPEVRVVVQRQAEQVNTAHDYVSSLKKSHR